MIVRGRTGSSSSADLGLAAVALVWGTTFVLVKNALADVSPVLFLALRFSIAAAALVLLFRSTPRRLAASGVLGRGIMAGVFLMAGYMLQTWGLVLTTPSKSAFLTGLYIVLVPLFGSIVYRSAPVPSEWIGVGLATVGMALLSLDFSSGLRIERGDLLTIACAVAFAIHILILGHDARPDAHQALSVLQVSTGAFIALGTFWWIEAAFVRWSTQVVGALAVTSLLATALAFAVQSWAQQHTSPTHVALILTLEPVFAWLTSWILTREVLSGRALAGAGLILAGIVLAELKPGKPRAHPLDWTPSSVDRSGL
jgi:drug/metabolite transporter (DMT)-like permease